MVKDQFYPETWRDQKVGRGVARFDSQKVARRLKDEEDENFFFGKPLEENETKKKRTCISQIT